MEEHPELQHSVQWSTQAQCYYRPVAGRSVSWDSETQTLQYDFDHFCPWMGTAVAGGNIRHAPTGPSRPWLSWLSYHPSVYVSQRIGSLCAVGGRAFYAFLVSVFALLGMVGVMGYFAMDTVRTQALLAHTCASQGPASPGGAARRWRRRERRTTAREARISCARRRAGSAGRPSPPAKGSGNARCKTQTGRHTEALCSFASLQLYR